MDAGVGTIAHMAKKKSKSGGEKPNRSPSYTVFARIPPELGEAFEAYISSLRPKPTATAVLQVCIEEFLKEKGFWPKEGK
jgi:hypothetical protein